MRPMTRPSFCLCSISQILLVLGYLCVGVLQLQAVHFTGNEAAEDGGALGVVKSLTSGAVAMTDGFLSDNRGRRGGAIFFQGGAELDLRSSGLGSQLVFEDNRAISGGAIFIELKGQTRHVINVGDVLFTKNFALETGDDNRRRLLQVEDKIMAPDTGGTDVRRGRGLRQTTSNLLRYITSGNGEIGVCGEGGGSAICMDLVGDQQGIDMEVEFFLANFTENVAEGNGKFWRMLSYNV